MAVEFTREQADLIVSALHQVSADQAKCCGCAVPDWVVALGGAAWEMPGQRFREEQEPSQYRKEKEAVPMMVVFVDAIRKARAF